MTTDAMPSDMVKTMPVSRGKVSSHFEDRLMIEAWLALIGLVTIWVGVCTVINRVVLQHIFQINRHKAGSIINIVFFGGIAIGTVTALGINLYHSPYCCFRNWK
jgi:hypothetical protein